MLIIAIKADYFAVNVCVWLLKIKLETLEGGEILNKKKKKKNVEN